MVVLTNQRPSFAKNNPKWRPLIGRNHQSLFPGGLILDSIDSGQCVSTESETFNISSVHGDLTCAFFKSGVRVNSSVSYVKKLNFILSFRFEYTLISYRHDLLISWNNMALNQLLLVLTSQGLLSLLSQVIRISH